MQRLADHAERYQSNFSVIMFDIDDFKLINDAYGHVMGDQVLKVFSQVVIKRCRKSDYFCRLGGDEFLLILSETSAENAYYVADKLNAEFSDEFKAQANLVCETSELPQVNLSLGVAAFEADLDTKELIHRADLALYQAKHQGKNRVTLFDKSFLSINTERGLTVVK